MSARDRVLCIVALLALSVVVNAMPSEHRDGIEFVSGTDGSLGSIIMSWGVEQEQLSDSITTEAVSDLEGNVVGEHKADGSNWSIPNILRFYFGG